VLSARRADNQENPLRSLIRPRLFAVAGLLLMLGGAAFLGSAQADDKTSPDATAAGTTTTRQKPTTGAHSLILGSKDGAQPKNMGQFLTAVTKDVDSYWTKTFASSGLPEPKVSYDWIPAGRTAASACGDEDGTLGDSAAAYCQGDDTIYISQKFATDIYNGTLDHALPGSSEGYGRTAGDFAVAYIVAHEYGH
jgi:predicted metalloprotease